MQKNELQVVKANSLVDASYRLSLAETRILYALLSQVQHTKEIPPGHVFRASYSDLAALLGDNVTAKAAKKDLKPVIEKMASRNFKLETGTAYVVLNWFQKIGCEDGEVFAMFSNDLLPFISELTSHYTKVDLQLVYQFDNQYAIRFYEWMKKEFDIASSQNKSAQLTLSVDELRHRLDLKKKYPRWNNMRARVIEPALREIEEKTDFRIDVITVKKAQVVDALVFDIKKKKSKSVDSSSNDDRSKVITINLQYIKNHSSEVTGNDNQNYDTAAACLKRKREAKGYKVKIVRDWIRKNDGY